MGDRKLCEMTHIDTSTEAVEAIETAVKAVNHMANDAITVVAREHAFQIAESIAELTGGKDE